MSKKKFAAASLALTAGVALSLTAPASPANAATHSPYWAKVASGSNPAYVVTFYANSNCTGSVVQRGPGGTISSDGWDAASVPRSWQDSITNDQPPHQFLALNDWPANICVALSNNIHLIYVN